jgi:hypothetical protein
VVLEVLALVSQSQLERDLLENAESLSTAQRALRILESARGGCPSSYLYSVGAEAIDRIDHVLESLSLAALDRAQKAARMLRNYSLTVEYADQRIEAARLLEAREPHILCRALGTRAGLARAVGDIQTNDAMLQRQREVAKQFRWNLADRAVLISMAKEAAFFSDHELAQQCYLVHTMRRFGLLNWNGPHHPGIISPEVVQQEDTSSLTPDFVESWITDNQGSLKLPGLGDVCYNLAKGLIDLGACADDEDSRRNASRWLDLANQLWKNNGMNGPIAIEFQRLRLRLMDEDRPSALEVGREMIRLSREWRRAPGRRGAALQATIDGEAGDTEVIKRLEELVEDAPFPDTAHIKVGIARWHLRAGDDAWRRSDDAKAGAIEHWRKSADCGVEAGALLAVQSDDGKPVYLSTDRFVDALTIAADAMSRLRINSAADEFEGSEELELRRRTLPAISKLLLAGRHPTRRRLIMEERQVALYNAAQLALDLGDHDTLDIVCETVRRDASGGVLFAISQDPNTDRGLASVARRIQSAAGADITDPGDEPEEESGESDGNGPGNGADRSVAEDGPENRAVKVQAQFEEALDVFQEIVGPVARAMFNPAMIGTATATGLLSKIEAPDASLSLWLRDDGTLIRHAAWRTEVGIEHEMDRVEVTADSLDGLRHGFYPRDYPDRSSVQRLQSGIQHQLEVLGNNGTLVPPRLRTVLLGAEAPIDLAVTPTGILDFPFGALPLDCNSDVLLLDKAAVTLVPSLLAGIALLDMPWAGAEEKAALAVYNTNDLQHTQAEYEALVRHLGHLGHDGRIRRIESFSELETALCVTAREPGWTGLICMAIHGEQEGDSGWSQIKRLPNGDQLTPSHILRWPMPLLAVMASCKTDVHEDSAGELGGFPLALQLRGARVVVGSLWYVNDQATSEIMSMMYEALSEGAEPAKALRIAQLKWIGADPETRRHNALLWPLLVPYGVGSHSGGQGLFRK